MVAARSVGRERPREVHGGGDDARGQRQQGRQQPLDVLVAHAGGDERHRPERRVAQPSSERFGAGGIVGAVEDRGDAVRERPPFEPSGPGRIGEARRDRRRTAADTGELQRLEQAHGDDGVGDLVTRRAARGARGP